MSILVESQYSMEAKSACFVVCASATCSVNCPKLGCGVDNT